MNLPKVRRIVTGHNAEGKAVIAMDGAPPETIERKGLLELIWQNSNWRTPKR
jgi:hypothetical protein